MGEVTGKTWTDYSEPRIMAADLEAIEAGIMVGQQAADAVEAGTRAEAAAADAEAALAAVQEISGLTGEDEAVAFLLGDPGSLAGAQLSTTFLTMVPESNRQGVPIPLGTPADWVADAGSPLITQGADPVHGPYIRIAGSASTSPGSQAWRLIDQPLTGGKFLTARIRRNDTNTSAVYALLSYDHTNATPRRIWNKGASGLSVGGWRRIILHSTEWEASTQAEVTTLKRLSIGPVVAAGTSSSIDIADLRIHDVSTVPHAAVAFIFDDARLDTYTEAFPLLSAKGWTGGVAVEHEQIGNADRITLAGLKEMYDAGWAMHGHHHVSMTTLTAAQQEAVHRASKAFLREAGFTRGDNVWVWPMGSRNDAADAIALRHWGTLRRVSTFQAVTMPYAYDPVDAGHRYAVSGYPLENAKSVVDRIAAEGGCQVFTFHSLVASGAVSEDWLISDFAELLDYIESKGVAVLPPSAIWTL